jgi:hypothetical protein
MLNQRRINQSINQYNPRQIIQKLSKFPSCFQCKSVVHRAERPLVTARISCVGRTDGRTGGRGRTLLANTEPSVARQRLRRAVDLSAGRWVLEPIDGLLVRQTTPSTILGLCPCCTSRYYFARVTGMAVLYLCTVYIVTFTLFKNQLMHLFQNTLSHSHLLKH